MTQTLANAPDLKNGYPRSPNHMLGPFVLLARTIDKCRAVIAGTNGEYKFDCPLDQRLFGFTQIKADDFKAQVEAGKSDEDMLAWVMENSAVTDEGDILAWSYDERWRRPEQEKKQYFERMRQDFAPDNHNIETWFQLLDADEGRFGNPNATGGGC